MSKKNKKKVSKKVEKKDSKGRVIFQLTALIVLVVLGIYFIFMKGSESETVNTGLENAIKNRTVYAFQKEGELSFTTPAQEFITKIDIEIAEDEAARETGLMYRSNMKENEGMFFIFQVQRLQSFWMKNTVIPLDIIFVNDEHEIVKIHKNTKPYSEQSYASEKPAKYVVEVKGGFCDKYGITEKDKITWRRL
jgi:uncharacterized membrane protein (UPF0127 family)